MWPVKTLTRAEFGSRGAILCGDWSAALAGRFDLVVSNPPYIASPVIERLDPEVRDHDPRPALDGGLDGLDAYRAIAADLSRLMAPRAKAVVEIGYDGAELVGECFRQAGWSSVSLNRDLEGQKRALLLER